jgi:transcriptional regulator with XRE-family HTH domain
VKHHSPAQLGTLLTSARENLHLSARQLSTRTGLHVTSILRIEHGEVDHPAVEVLRTLAGALGVPAADLLVAAGYGDTTALPSFAPYLRAKYRDLSDKDIADLQRSLDALTGERSSAGPIDGEDEH